MTPKILCALCLATFCQTARSAPTIPDLRHQFPRETHQFADLEKGRTHYELSREGDRPTVVLVHGVSGPLSVWDRTVPQLAQAGWQTLRYDLYGRGMSARLDADAYTLDLYVSQLEDLIQAVGLNGPIVLVGSSMGAVIASEYTLRHPGRVTALLLIGPAGFPVKTPPLAKLKDVPFLGSMLRRIAGEKVILEQNRKYFFEDPPADFWHYFSAQLAVTGTKEAMTGTMRHTPVTHFLDRYQELSHLDTPVGVIWGREDATFPYENHSSLLTAVRQASLATIERAAHLPQYERPYQTNAAIIDFLENGKFSPSPSTPGPLFNSDLAPDWESDGTGAFETPFFQKFPVHEASLALSDSVVKTYRFPSRYAGVISGTSAFTADKGAVEALLPGGGLKPITVRPGRVMVTLSAFHYAKPEGMKSYNEIALSVPVDDTGSASIHSHLRNLLSPRAAFVLTMPVSSLENEIRGRKIWGLAKTLMPITIEDQGDALVSQIGDELEFRVPLAKGRHRVITQDISLLTVKNAIMHKSRTVSHGAFDVTYRPSCLLAGGKGAFDGDLRILKAGNLTDLLRSIDMDACPFMTRSSRDVSSVLDLPMP